MSESPVSAAWEKGEGEMSSGIEVGEGVLPGDGPKPRGAAALRRSAESTK